MKTKNGKSLVLLLTAAMIITLANVNYVNAASKKTGAATLKQVSVSGKESVKITWKTTSGVKKYTIYRAISKNGSYKKLKTVSVKTTKGSYTDKTVKYGKTYFYKIKGKGLKVSKIKKITVKAADQAADNGSSGTNSAAATTAPSGNNGTGNSNGSNADQAGTTATPDANQGTGEKDPDTEPAVNDTTKEDIKDKTDNIGNTETVTDNSASIIKVTQSTKLVLEGNLSEKSIVCETDNIIVNVVLKNANVTNKTVPLIRNTSSKSEVIVTAQAGTTNTITADTGYSSTDELISSEGDLTFEGDGTLNIVNKSSEVNAAKSEANLILCGENISVQSVKKGFVGKPVSVISGTVTINSEDDSIKAKGKNGFIMKAGKVVLTSKKDGINSNKMVNISGGRLEITAGDDGIQCGDGGSSSTTATPSPTPAADSSTSVDYGYINISGGIFVINSTDHGVTANGTAANKDEDYAIKITGGTFTINTEATYTQGNTNAGGGWGGGGMEAQKTVYNATGGDAINSDTGAQISGATLTTDKCNDGVQATYSLIISDSTFTINAYGKGLKAGTSENSEYIGSLKVAGGTYKINSLDDAIHSDNDVTATKGEFTISTADDGLHANKTLNLGVEGGSDDDLTIDILAGKVGTVSVTPYEGYEAAEINYYSGNFTAVVSDDGINAAGGTDSSGSAGGNDPFRPGGGGGWNPGGGGPGGGGGGSNYGELNIYGGNIYLNCGGDSVDSNGKITMSAGTLKIDGSNNGADDVIDWDSGFTLSGGEIAAVGTSGVSTRVASSATQRNVMFKGSRSSIQANDKYELKDSSGNVIFSGTTVRSSNVFYFTSAQFTNGTYDLYIDGTKKGSVTFSSASDGKTVSI